MNVEECYRNLQECVEIERNVQKLIGMYYNLQEYNECMLWECIGVYWNAQECIGMYIEMYRNVYKFIGMYGNGMFRNL